MNKDGGIRLLKYDTNLDLIDQGACDEGRALEELHAAHAAGLQRYDSGEEAVAKSSFVLSRSESDFLRIDCNGDTEIDIDSDRLIYPSKVSRIFSTMSRISLRVDRIGAEEMIRDYLEMSRAEFEAEYQPFFCR